MDGWIMEKKRTTADNGHLSAVVAVVGDAQLSASIHSHPSI